MNALRRQVHRRLGGGSMTMVAVLSGLPATGESLVAQQALGSYRHLSDAQKMKLLAALESRQQQAPSAADPECNIRTEVLLSRMGVACTVRLWPTASHSVCGYAAYRS